MKALFVIGFICLLFFYKFFLGLLPFPGDLLISQYQPWRSFSYLGYNAGSYPTKDQYFDVVRQIYPWKTESLNQIKNGQIPLWNPYNFSGTPLLANFQSAVFYPLNLIYLFLPQAIAWSILVFLQPLLASIFTYLFVRNLGLSKLASFFSSIIFSYSLFMSVFLEYNTIGHVILWLPMILLSIDKILECFIVENPKIKNLIVWSVVFVFSLCSSFFAGHLQIFSYVVLLSFIYLIFRITQSTLIIHIIRVKLVFFGFLGILIAIITAPQWLATMELIKESARIRVDYNFLINQLLLQPKDLLRFLSPDLFGNPAVKNYLLNDPYPGKAVYVGLVSFIFSFTALWQFKKNAMVKFFSLFALTFFLFLFRWSLTEWLYKFDLPLISTSSPANGIFILSFCLAILAGFGLEEINRNKRKILGISLVICFVFLTLWVLKGNFSLIPKNLLYSSGLFFMIFIIIIAIQIIKTEKFLFALKLFLLILTILDLFYFFNKFNPFVSQKLIFPQNEIFSWLKENAGINRFWGYGTANIEANFASQYGLFSTDGYDPLYIRRYGEFIQSSRDGKTGRSFNRATRSDARIEQGFGETDLNKNFYRQRVLDLLGVKYILDRVENGSTEQTFPVERYKMVYENNDWKIFENLKAAPRIFLTSDYKVFKTKEAFEELFFDKNFNPSRTILLEEEVNEIKKTNNTWFDDSNDRSGLKVVFYGANKILIEIKTQNAQFLFLSDNYYPGWKALIDGKETKIYRANYAFRAVMVPAGSHKIVFSYQPSFLSKVLK